MTDDAVSQIHLLGAIIAVIDPAKMMLADRLALIDLLGKCAALDKQTANRRASESV